MLLVFSPRTRAIVVAGLYLLAQPTSSATQVYNLDTSYSGAAFFDGFNFWDVSTKTEGAKSGANKLKSNFAQDPTHGFVKSV
jgi:hypothetical protein